MKVMPIRRLEFSFVRRQLGNVNDRIERQALQGPVPRHRQPKQSVHLAQTLGRLSHPLDSVAGLLADGTCEIASERPTFAGMKNHSMLRIS